MNLLMTTEHSCTTKAAQFEPPADPVCKPSALVHAGEMMAARLAKGTKLTSTELRAVMEQAFGGTDSNGAWIWKDAYEAVEIAQVVFLRRYLPAMRKAAGSPAALLTMLTKFGDLLPTHTRRSDDSIGLQQFSTPLELAFLAAEAAGIAQTDHVLEPSAGTGQLAVFAEARGATLHLNEISNTRSGILERLYPRAARSRRLGMGPRRKPLRPLGKRQHPAPLGKRAVAIRGTGAIHPPSPQPQQRC